MLTTSRTITVSITAAAVLTATTALAQVPPAAAPAAAPTTADERALFLDVSRVASASRYEQDTQDAPASITIITAEDIRRYGYRHLADALNGVRGFWINNDRNYSYLGVRGFAVPGDYNSRILILVDGHRLNDNVYGSALVGTEEVIDLDLVERIEVVRGPSSSLYGSSAVFGVINIVTRRGRWLEGGTARVSAGSWRSGRASVTYGARTRRGVEMLFGGSAFQTRGPDVYFPELAETGTHDGIARGRDGDRYRRGFAKVVAGDVTIEGGVSSRRKTIPTASYGTVFGADNWTRDARAFGLVRFDRTFGNLSRVSTTVSLDRSEYEGNYVYDDGELRDFGTGAWWTATGQYDRGLGSRHRLLTGGEFRYHLRRDQSSTFNEEPLLEARRHGHPWGLFVQDEVQVADDLRLNLGLRYEHRMRYSRIPSPRLSALWTPGPWAFKVLYGAAFRAPNAYELYFHDNGLSTKAPAHLDPERIRTVEAVVERQVRPELRVSASWFHMSLSDLVRLDVDPVDSLLVFQNLNRAESTGFELEGSYRSGAGVDASAAYTLQIARDPDAGARLNDAPRHLFQARASTTIGDPRLRASLALRRVATQVMAGAHPSPAYVHADAAVIGELPDERLAFELCVSNLFNRRYGTPGGEEQAMLLIPQDGRSIRLGLRVGF